MKTGSVQTNLVRIWWCTDDAGGIDDGGNNDGDIDGGSDDGGNDGGDIDGESDDDGMLILMVVMMIVIFLVMVIMY